MTEKPFQISSTKKNLCNDYGDGRKCICCINCPNEDVTPVTETSFERIKISAKIRKEHGKEHEQYLKIEKTLPDTYNPDIHGYHRSCYQKFTNTKRIENRSQQSNILPVSPRTTPKRKPSSTTSPLFPTDCIICDKRKKRQQQEEKTDKFSTELIKNNIKSRK